MYMNHTIHSNYSKQLLYQTIEKIDGAYAPSTIRAYREDFEDLIKFAESHSQSALPADHQTITSFIQHLIKRGKKSASIRRAIAGISSIHTLSGEHDPTKAVDVKLSLRRMHRAIGRYSHQALGITKEKLDALLAVTDNNLRGCRDRALLMTAYDTLCRRSELLSLRAEDIDEQMINHKRHTVIFLRRSKIDQDAHGKWLPVSENTSQAINAWLNQSQINSGLLFRGVDRANRPTEKLDNSQLAKIYKKLAKKAKFNEQEIKSISGHSTRVGAAQDLLLSGASLAIIMHKGRWSKTETVMRYVEKVGIPI
jgi:site-specific recombinase XerD